jgi:hypothetical protein
MLPKQTPRFLGCGVTDHIRFPRLASDDMKEELQAAMDEQEQVTPETQVVETPPVVESVPENQPSAADLRALAREMGYGDEDLAAYKDDNELGRDLLYIANEYGKMQPLAQLGRKVAPYADRLGDFEKWVAEQDAAKKQPAQEPAPEGTPQFLWDTPEYDPAWEHLSEQDDPMGTARAKLNRYRQFQAETIQKFIQNPQELISRAIEPILHQKEQSIQEQIQAAVKQEREAWQNARAEEAAQAEEQAWLRQNMKDLYALDGSGNLVYGRDGQAVLTKYGSQVFQAYSWARGLKGPEGKPLSVKEASELAMLRVPKAQQTQTTPPAPKPGEQRFLDTVSEAERHPERRPLDESAPADQYPDDEHAFRSEARRLAAANGINL